MARERVVIDSFDISQHDLNKDKTVKAAVDAWFEAAAVFVEARKASETAKDAMQMALGPKLRGEGIKDGVRWDIKKSVSNVGHLTVEILEGGEKSRKASSRRTVSFQ